MHDIELVASATGQSVRSIKDAVSRGVVTPTVRTSGCTKAMQFTTPQLLGLCISAAMRVLADIDPHTCDMVANHVGKMKDSEIEAAVRHEHGAWSLLVIPGHEVCPDLMPASVIAGEALRRKIKQKFGCDPIGIDIRTAYGKLLMLLQAAEKQK